MDQKVSSIEIESLVNTHQKPFVVIDKNYRIIAANQACEKVYGYPNKAAIGMKCYTASHGRDRPCAEDGELCPHDQVLASGETSVCNHFHSDILEGCCRVVLRVRNFFDVEPTHRECQNPLK